MKAGLFILIAISIAIFAKQANPSSILPQDVGHEHGGHSEYNEEDNEHSMTRKYNAPSTRRVRRFTFR